MSEARVERYQNARAALDMMARELQSAFILTSSSVYRLKEITSGYSGGIYFTTSAIRVTTDVYEVGYSRRTSDNVLLKEIQTPPNSTETDGSSSELAQNIMDLVFEYGYYESAANRNNGLMTWRSARSSPVLQWNSNIDNVTNYYKNNSGNKNPDGLPEAIRIGLAVRDEKSYETAQSFYTIVYLPNAE